MIELTARRSPPAWALWERYLLDTMSRAAVEFVGSYTRPDGTLIWREEWPGMDGSDDAYESFFNFPLLYALGGDPALDELARREWEAITRQFTAYGQVWREFDAGYDWMHHGESSLLFYFFGLANPKDNRMRGRARRFAAMYMGEDPDAPNYDPERKLIRSPINGSRGPRFENTAEDWVTHRPILAHYPPPFDDVPGIPSCAKTADWNDAVTFAEILKLLNARMMRGDVPLNLTATSLIANAFLYTGEEKYRAWVRDYVAAWRERAAANDGLLPDNVGLSGKIGECMEGKWWGGYYGWRWPHGFMNLIQSALIGAANALLLTGDASFLELPRRLLDRVYEQGREIEGEHRMPHRHGDAGWYDFRAPDATYPIQLWYLSMDAADEGRIARWSPPPYEGEGRGEVVDARGKGDDAHASAWHRFISGRHPDYPEAILRVNHAEMCRRLAAIRRDDGDPETWDIHHWQNLNPVVCEGLVQLMLGGPQTIYHGGLLHCRLRYFDPVRKHPGLPPDVAALVDKVDADGVEVELVNLNPMAERRIILQAGAFAEHRFTGAIVGDSGEEVAIGSPHVEMILAPAAGGRLRLPMERCVNAPTYAQPF
jgi:hypothetical protein